MMTGICTSDKSCSGDNCWCGFSIIQNSHFKILTGRIISFESIILQKLLMMWMNAKTAQFVVKRNVFAITILGASTKNWYKTYWFITKCKSHFEYLMDVINSNFMKIRAISRKKQIISSGKLSNRGEEVVYEKKVWHEIKKKYFCKVVVYYYRKRFY